MSNAEKNPFVGRIMELMEKSETPSGLDRSEALELVRIQRQGLEWTFNDLAQNPPSSTEIKQWDRWAKHLLHS